LHQTDQQPTGAAFIILNQIGGNGIIIDVDAVGLMDAEFIDTAEAQIVVTDIVMAVLAISVEGAVRAVVLQFSAK